MADHYATPENGRNPVLYFSREGQSKALRYIGLVESDRPRLCMSVQSMRIWSALNQDRHQSENERWGGHRAAPLNRP